MDIAEKVAQAGQGPREAWIFQIPISALGCIMLLIKPYSHSPKTKSLYQLPIGKNQRKQT